MAVPAMLFRLEPSDDEQSRKQGSHQLAEVGAQGGMGAEETWLSEQIKHGTS
jgi:hypothetical protein